MWKFAHITSEPENNLKKYASVQAKLVYSEATARIEGRTLTGIWA